jgi:alpha-N-acetylglucosamine transferase
LEFTFHCLTDDPADLNSEIRVLELEGGWTGWWGKATLFTLQLKGRMFYIDLDMIVTRNIDEILNYRGTFSILRTDEIACEKANKNGYNSSLMAWNSK